MTTIKGPLPATGVLVSVIMPCHNSAAFVAEAVGSVLGQTHQHLELIVVDDGSTDDSRRILRQLVDCNPDRMRLVIQRNAGPYPARNTGLRQARGELVAFLDADDWWSPDCLERLTSVASREDVDLVYCGWQNVGEGLRSSPYLPPAYEDEEPVGHFLRTCPWPIHAALVRRSLVDRVGGFSERRYSSMDYDFWLRALGVSRRIKRVPEVLAYYRWHNAGQISAVKWRQVLDALAVQQDFIRNHPGLVEHLSAEQIRHLTEGQVLRQAYRALWKRDLVSAQRLFRHVAWTGGFRLADTGHVASALLPLPLYRTLAKLADRGGS